MAHTTTLRAVPALGGLYARALVPRHATASPLPDTQYRVPDVVADPARLLAYQRLVGEPVADVLPPGFVHVMAFPLAMAVMVRRDFPLPAPGMVHIANTVSVTRPIGASEHVEIRAWAQDLRDHRRGTLVDLVTEVRVVDAPSREEGTEPPRAASEPAWRGVSTYLSKSGTGERRGGSQPLDRAEPTDLAGTADRASFDPPDPTARWVLDAATGRRYAAVSGDRNPIHLSALGAKAFGFRRTVAHGMYTASRALAQVGRPRGDAFTWTVEFAAPVLLPGTVDLAITRREPAAGTTAAGTTAAGTSAAADIEYVAWGPRSRRVHFSGTVVRH